MRQLALCAVVLLSACASSKYYEESLNTWIGADEQRLVNAWGAPVASYPMEKNEKIISYLHAGPANTMRDSRAKLSSASQEYCKTDFYLDGSNRIIRWHWDGRCAVRKPNRD